jgi:hypothetical protein
MAEIPPSVWDKAYNQTSHDAWKVIGEYLDKEYGGPWWKRRLKDWKRRWNLRRRRFRKVTTHYSEPQIRQVSISREQFDALNQRLEENRRQFGSD